MAENLNRLPRALVASGGCGGSPGAKRGGKACRKSYHDVCC